MKRAVAILSALALAGCASTGVVASGDNTYTASAEYGSLTGSWGRATQEARGMARAFCDGRGRSERVVVLSEIRSGVFGVTPQRVSLVFACRMDPASG